MVSVGRSVDATVCLRQGGHSDQNLVALRHASIERVPGGARVVDHGTTNGTFVGGARARDALAAPGSMVVFAATMFARVDGAAIA